MGKRYRGKPCAYCDGVGVGPDHIFARALFLIKDRDNLPQVSARESCNGAKSQLEHYLLTILPFAGEHPSSREVLLNSVPRRLEKNRKLQAQLSTGRRDILISEGDSVRETITIPFDASKLAQLFVFITKGLVVHHWNLRVPSNYSAYAGFVTSEQDTELKKIMMNNVHSEVRCDLGRGLVLYQGVQKLDDPLLILWRFRIYGRIMFGRDTNSGKEIQPDIWALTSRTPVPHSSMPG